eukprot:915876-Pyramimonas_sp.AAC.2
MPNFVYSDGAAVPAKSTNRGQPVPDTGATRHRIDDRGAAKGKGRLLEASHLAENSSVWDCMRHKGQMDTDLDKTKKKKNVPMSYPDEEKPYVPMRDREGRETVAQCLTHDNAIPKQRLPAARAVRDRVVPPWVVPSCEDVQSDRASVCSYRSAVSKVSKAVSGKQPSVVEARKSTLPREVKQELMKRVNHLSKELDFEMKARQHLEEQQQALASQLERVQA